MRRDTLEKEVVPQEGLIDRVAALMDDIRAAAPDLRGFDVLSMGMSHDYPAAIRHGATHVRVGTAIFGERC